MSFLFSIYHLSLSQGQCLCFRIGIYSTHNILSWYYVGSIWQQANPGETRWFFFKMVIADFTSFTMTISLWVFFKLTFWHQKMAGTGDDEVDGKLQEWMKIDQVRNEILINLWLQKIGHIIINSEFNMEKQNTYNPLFIEQCIYTILPFL